MEGKTLIGSIGTVLLALLAFILILYLAYVATKKIGKRMTIRGAVGKNIKILDSISIGQQGSMIIIETGGKVLLVGVTQHSMTLISELDPNELGSVEDSPSGGPMEFSQAFKKVLEEKFGRRKKTDKESNENHDDSPKA